jgi:hypothetical protein
VILTGKNPEDICIGTFDDVVTLKDGAIVPAGGEGELVRSMTLLFGFVTL